MKYDPTTRMRKDVVCSICKTSFKTTGNTAKYCSHACLLTAHYRKRGGPDHRPPKLIHCAYYVCNKEFMQIRSSNKYCSQQCWHSDASLRNRKIKKLWAINYLGAKCSKCGYSRSIYALDFHHVDPTTKEYNISSMLSNRGKPAIKKELDKCVLLCSNCHRELEQDIAEGRRENGIARTHIYPKTRWREMARSSIESHA